MQRLKTALKKTKAIYIYGISVFVLTGFFSQCGGQKRIPAQATRPTFLTSPQAGFLATDKEMRLVHSPKQSFWIDPFEQSELNANEYFTAPHQMPRVSISVHEASKACEMQGKRLCTYTEWSNACLGTHRRRYAYGSSNNKNACNTGSRKVAPTASYKECSTDTGLHDMIGNSMEWVADTRSGMAIAMGGSFHTGQRADCFTSFYFHPGIKSEQIGFRCCRDRKQDTSPSAPAEEQQQPTVEQSADPEDQKQNPAEAKPKDEASTINSPQTESKAASASQKGDQPAEPAGKDASESRPDKP